MGSHSVAVLPLVVIACFWGASNLMIKLVLNDFSVSALTMWRWIGVSVVMWTLLAKPSFRQFMRVKLPARKDALSAVLIGLFCMGPAQTLLCYGLTLTTTIEGTALNASGPVWAALLAIFILKERLNSQMWFAIGVGFVGAYILTIGFTLPEFKESSATGNLVYLVGVIFEMAGMVLAKKVILRSPGMGTIAWQMVGTAVWSSLVPVLIPSLFVLEYKNIGWISLTALGYLILFAGVLCFTAWYKIAEKTPVSFMALVITVEPVVAALLGSLFLKEPLTLELILGMTLVLAAVGVAAIEKPLTRIAVRKVTKYQTQKNQHRDTHNEEPGIGLGSVFQVGREEAAD